MLVLVGEAVLSEEGFIRIGHSYLEQYITLLNTHHLRLSYLTLTFYTKLYMHCHGYVRPRVINKEHMR